MQSSNITTDGKSEMYHTSIVAEKVIQKLKDYPIEIKSPRDGASISEVQTLFRTFKPDFSADLHTNAGGGHWCTVLCGKSSRKFAECVYKYISLITPGKDRGVVDGSQFAFVNGGGIIIEMLFHDSEEDMAWYKQHYDDLADAIVKGILEYLNIKEVGDESMKVIVPYSVADLGSAQVLASNIKAAVMDWGKVSDTDDVIQIGGPADAQPQKPCKSFKIISGTSRLETAENVCKCIREGI
jgi:hypothetical protein